MQAERPFVRGQERNNLFQLALQRSGKVGPRFQKIFKIRSGEHEHFTRAVAAEEIIAAPRTGHLDPAREVVHFLLWLLGEEIVGDAECHLALAMQLLDD